MGKNLQPEIVGISFFLDLFSGVRALVDTIKTLAFPAQKVYNLLSGMKKPLDMIIQKWYLMIRNFEE